MKYILKILSRNIFSIFFVVNIAVGLWGISVMRVFQYDPKANFSEQLRPPLVLISSYPRKFDDGQ